MTNRERTTFIIAGISENNGGYILHLRERQHFKAREERRTRWKESDDWYSGNDLSSFRFPPSGNVATEVPVNSIDFARLNLFVGQEVKLKVEPVGALRA